MLVDQTHVHLEASRKQHKSIEVMCLVFCGAVTDKHLDGWKQYSDSYPRHHESNMEKYRESGLHPIPFYNIHPSARNIMVHVQALKEEQFIITWGRWLA